MSQKVCHTTLRKTKESVILKNNLKQAKMKLFGQIQQVFRQLKEKNTKRNLNLNIISWDETEIKYIETKLKTELYNRGRSQSRQILDFRQNAM